MLRASVFALALVGCAKAEAPPPPEPSAAAEDEKPHKSLLHALGLVPDLRPREPIGLVDPEPVRTCFVSADGQPLPAATVEVTDRVVMRGMVASLNYSESRGCGKVLTGADGCADLPNCRYLSGHPDGIRVETTASRYSCGEAVAGDRVVVAKPGCVSIQPRRR